MRETLRVVYRYRSNALHGGTPFPLPMCYPPHRLGDDGVLTEKPSGLASATLGGVWVANDIPIHLHIFEYIVRSVLLTWWGKMISDDTSKELYT